MIETGDFRRRPSQSLLTLVLLIFILSQPCNHWFYLDYSGDHCQNNNHHQPYSLPLTSVTDFVSAQTNLLSLPPDAGDLVILHILVLTAAPDSHLHVVHHLILLLTEHGVSISGVTLLTIYYQVCVWWRVKRVQTSVIVIGIAGKALDAVGQRAETAQHHHDMDYKRHSLQENISRNQSNRDQVQQQLTSFQICSVGASNWLELTTNLRCFHLWIWHGNILWNSCIFQIISSRHTEQLLKSGQLFAGYYDLHMVLQQLSRGW